MENNQIIQEILAYIKHSGGTPKEWYVGIAQDAINCLFSDHRVIAHGGYWIYKPADNNSDARAIENFFLNQFGADGGPGGGDTSSTIVYAYRKNSITNP
jgi:hypothetical protein